jgi:hypothetical protein
MSVKTPINTAIHVIFCTAIALLLAFIIHENAMDYDNDIQLLAQKTAQNGQLAIAMTNNELLREFKKQTKDYPSASTKAYNALVQVIKLKSDSIQYLLDSLSENEDDELLYTVQGMLHQQRSLISEMSDFEKSTEAALPSFIPADWLYQSWKNDTQKQFKTVLEQAKMNSFLMEYMALNYVASKGGVSEMSCFVPYPRLCIWELIYPNIGDTVRADILIGDFPKKYPDQHFFVNGIPVPDQKFRQRFDNAGIYPLRIKVEHDYWEHDTIVVAEKTYYVTVRK